MNGMEKIARLSLADGSFAIVDEADHQFLSKFRWCARRIDGRVVAIRTSVRGRYIGIGRILLDAPMTAWVDHINGDVLDNRRCNLRLCTPAENGKNKRRHRQALKAPFKGVFPQSGRYYAKLMVDGRRIALGGYATPEEAAAAYDAGARAHFGEFASFNFPAREIAV